MCGGVAPPVDTGFRGVQKMDREQAKAIGVEVNRALAGIGARHNMVLSLERNLPMMRPQTENVNSRSDYV